MKLTKNRKKVQALVDSNKLYSLREAAELVKKSTTCKFNASVDLHVRLGIDPRKADQAIRGTTALPHGTGRDKKVLVLCTPDKEDEARKAGADYVGLDEFVDKIVGGWIDMDVVIATPSVMPKIAKLGRVLGPRNLMPNPKVGTVTPDVATAVKNAKAGQVQFRVDKAGIVHGTIGRRSFDSDKLQGNLAALIDALVKAKPASSKGVYLRKVAISSTMGVGVRVDTQTIAA